MLLDGKTAVIYGGAGRVGSAVARAFAREGAQVHLAGRTQAKLDAVAGEIGAAGTAVVDALDGAAVEAHAEGIGAIDISMNVISHGDVQGTPMLEMDVEDYLAPVVNGVRTTFLTATAGARRMRDGGVILIFGGSGDPLRGYSLGGLQTGFDALESMRRQLASELGAPRRARRDAADRRHRGVAARGLRGPRPDRRRHRGRDDARARRDVRGRRERGRVRRLRPRPEHDRGDRQHQLRDADRLSADYHRPPR